MNGTYGERHPHSWSRGTPSAQNTIRFEIDSAHQLLREVPWQWGFHGIIIQLSGEFSISDDKRRPIGSFQNPKIGGCQ